MNELVLNSTTIGLAISLLGYGIGVTLKKKFKYAILNPILISIVFVISLLLILDIDYESYQSSAKYLSYLLTPATVCLAIPLYQQIQLLKDHMAAIVIGIVSGVFTSLSSVLALSVLFGLTHEEYVTLLPKSITTAIGMGVSEEFGGYVSITVAVIIITGIFGNMCAETVCRVAKVTDPVAKGIAIGSSSHAIGTARAMEMEMGEIEGAMSSLSIVISGILTLVGVSVFAGLL